MSGRQVEVIAGPHLVASKGGAVVVVAHRQTAPLTRESDAVRTWSALHDLIMEAAAKDGERFGRALSRLVAKWVAGQPDEVEFGVLSPVDGGYAVFLRGGVTALITQDNGLETMRGTDATTFVDGIRPVNERAALLVSKDDGPKGFPLERGIGSLDEGVAPGSGAVLWLTDNLPEVLPAAADQPASQPVSTTDLIEDNRVSVGDKPAGEPVKVELKAPKTFDSFKPSDKPPPPRQPLPVKKATPTKRSEGTRRQKIALNSPVRGVKCANGHLNDPRVAFCRLCGLRMNETKVIVDGERPPLGFLVLDDGTPLILQSDCVIGREPEQSPSIEKGATPIRLVDPAGQLSRAHAEIRLIEWDVAVVDLGSKNGTHVKPPGYQGWQRLNPQQPYQLIAGSEVLVGSRRVIFESYHAHI